MLDDPPDPLSMPSPAKPSRNRGAEVDLRMKDMEVVPADLRDEDDFRTFVESSPFRVDCRPLEWCSRSEQESRYPGLYHMAMAILSIPAESSEPERAFSGSRRTCSSDRLSISCSNIQRIECIGSWIREGHIQLSSSGRMGLLMEAMSMDEDGGLGGEIVDEIEWT